MFARRLLILLLFVLSGVAAAQDEPPFVYYPYDDGYMIERADGTDSHFVGGSINTHPAKRDAAWSPSGKWLVWRAVDSGGCGMSGEPAEQLVIASAESAALLPYGDWVRFTWASSHDQLFVVSSRDDALQWQLIDPAAPDAPLASGDLAEEAGVSGSLLQAFFDSSFTRADRNDNLEHAALSADGQWLAYIDDGPVMVDRASGEARLIAPSVHGYGGNRGGYIKWHPSQNWFISIEEGIAGCGSSYHTQVTDGSTRYEIDYSNSVEWLPPQVDPHTFPVFEKPPQSPQPQPFATLHTLGWIEELQWNEDGQILFTYPGYGPGSAAAWDVATGALLDAEIPALPPEPEGFYGEGNDVADIRAESPGHVITGYGVFERETGTRIMSAPEDWFMMGGSLQFSADERFMLTAGRLAPLRIWSLPDGVMRFEGLTTTAAALSPDMETVAVASGWDVHLYSIDALVSDIE